MVGPDDRFLLGQTAYVQGANPLGGLSAVAISKSEVGMGPGCTVATQRIIISLGEVGGLIQKTSCIGIIS